MLLTTFSRFIVVSTLLLVGQTSWAATVLVAVAANFSKAIWHNLPIVAINSIVNQNLNGKVFN
ncbi:MAG: hypothetical protein PHG00_02660 [Methylococcales bacterium]|nr:hypothetical protein [Methylococcales bacterium]